MNITFKTAESVCEGHPDKLCDKIADAILDAYLYKDKGAHVAVEVMAVGRRIIVAGEISSTAKVNIQSVVWRVLDKVGMTSFWRFVQVYVRKQSPDIAGGVNYEALRYQTRIACQEAGIEYRGEHVFRHTFATNCYHKGIDVKILSRLLGHADVNITYNLYIHLYGDGFDEMYSALTGNG